MNQDTVTHAPSFSPGMASALHADFTQMTFFLPAPGEGGRQALEAKVHDINKQAFMLGHDGARITHLAVRAARLRGRPARLVALYAAPHGEPLTLEDVFDAWRAVKRHRAKQRGET